MRTTLTLEDDVAKGLQQLKERRRASLKSVVNEALRAGLERLLAPTPRRRARHRTGTFRGEPLVDNVDNVAEVLALAEGEDFK